MNFIIKLNRSLDQEIFLEALDFAPDVVKNIYPDISTEQAVKTKITEIYSDDRILKARQELTERIPILEKTYQIICQLLDYQNQIEIITIILGATPIFPRFLAEKSFVVPYYWKINDILRVCIHEMTHFVYFAKLAEVTREEIDTESPSLDYIISEIVAPLIVNNPKIQRHIHSLDRVFIPDHSLVSDEKIAAISKLFASEKDIAKFRKLAIKELGRV